MADYAIRRSEDMDAGSGGAFKRARAELVGAADGARRSGPLPAEI